MKQRLILTLSIGLLAAAQVSALDLTSDQDKLSYALGQQIGEQISKYLKQQKTDIDKEIFSTGIVDALYEKQSLMTHAEIGQAIIKSKESQKKAMEQQTKDGEAFLAANTKKEGVITLKSGLQYKVITAGTGKTPKATDKVTTHYRGTLIDGTEFDSSYKRKAPASFPVNGVIAGWTEALQLMKEGAKWQLFIPSNLAYGAHGAGANIGPNATLIFDIELISVD
ncbi:MAG: FKBP-type peptidyl-prolyl cis-trans isomerase [Thiomargarita sp.]|nr:FKBP-type peptidyl-prolyl cis-trans isomerase [Thiomargarita sp.]